MRLGEECPYITPCGWCSRKEAPCNSKRNRPGEPRKRVFWDSQIPVPPPPERKKDCNRS